MGTLKARYPSGQWTAILGSGFDAANTARWNSAWGFVASQKSAGSSWSNATSTLSDITATNGLNSVTAYLYASRKYRVYFQAQFLDTAAGASEFVVLQPAFNGVTYSENNALNMPAANIGIFTWYETIYTPAADGNVTFKMQGRRGSSSTGTVSITNANNAPLLYMIEDLGPITPASISPPTAGPRVVAEGNALGVVAVGSFIPMSGGAIAAATVTPISNPLPVFLAVGRRYRIHGHVRAMAAPLQNVAGTSPGVADFSTAAAGYLRVTQTGTAGLVGNTDTWVIFQGNYQGNDLTMLLDGTGATETFTLNAYLNRAGSLWNDQQVSFFYVEDVGPNTYPALPIPATPPAWTPLSGYQSTWVAYPGAGFGVPSYRKIGDEVMLRGLVQSGAITAGNSVMAALPAGFQPPTNQLFPVQVGANPPGTASTTMRLDVLSGSGNLRLFGAVAGGYDYVSLSSVRFSTTA